MLQKNKESNSHRLIQKPFTTKLGKNENSLILEHFLLISQCSSF